MTHGEYLVGIDFNPSGDDAVGQIKRKAADLIDLINSIGIDGVGERGRLKSLAITQIETAAMFGVKAATKKEQP